MVDIRSMSNDSTCIDIFYKIIIWIVMMEVENEAETVNLKETVSFMTVIWFAFYPLQSRFLLLNIIKFVIFNSLLIDLCCWSLFIIEFKHRCDPIETVFHFSAAVVCFDQSGYNGLCQLFFIFVFSGYYLSLVIFCILIVKISMEFILDFFFVVVNCYFKEL